jgi:hypothetical protein
MRLSDHELNGDSRALRFAVHLGIQLAKVNPGTLVSFSSESRVSSNLRY